MNGRKKIGLWIIAAVIVILIIYGFMPRPVPVSTAEVHEGSMQVIIEEEGKTKVKDRYSIMAPVAGFIQRLPYEVGDDISKGQSLFLLEPLPSQTLDPRQQAQARASVEAAEAALKASNEAIQVALADSSLASAEYSRIQNLFATGSATDQMLDQAEASRQRAESHLRSAIFSHQVATHEYEAARTALDYVAFQGPAGNRQTVSVFSPISGCVLRIYRKDEGITGAGQPILDIGDSGALEIVVDVLSEDAVRIAPGMRVLLQRWGGDHNLEGVVDRIEPVGFTKISALGVEEQRVLTHVHFTSPASQWSRLGDGYRLQVQFILWESDSVVQIPGSALFREGQNWAVFIVQDHRVRTRQVRIGRRSGLTVQVLEGLEPGEIVVTHPEETIAEGSRVRTR